MRFLIPVDFSEASADMLRFTFELNRHFFAKLQVLHLFDIPITVGDDSEMYLKNYEAYRKSYDDEVWEFVRRNKGEYRYETEVFATSGGHYQGIVDFAGKHHPDLIVIGHRGAGALRRWFFGSVSRYLLSHPPAPVLSVPQGYAPKGDKPITRILIATDLLDRVPEESATFLKDFAQRLNAEIRLLHVRVKDELILPDEEKVRKGLDSGFGAAVEIVPAREGEDLGRAIGRYVEERGIDLLVTIPHPHTWLDQLLLGSETRELAGVLEIPIMSLPSK